MSANEAVREAWVAATLQLIQEVEVLHAERMRLESLLSDAEYVGIPNSELQSKRMKCVELQYEETLKLAALFAHARVLNGIASGV